MDRRVHAASGGHLSRVRRLYAGAYTPQSLRRRRGFNLFVPDKGGDVLMYQHVFCFYSHPAV
jgi:heme/copper-type cytochrome/quinol oxidase subunit 1